MNGTGGEVISAATIARFWPKVTRGTKDECWIWRGAVRGTCGYGMLSVDGRLRGSHCVSWMIEHGSIPAGLEICHTCDNRVCVNPTHLFVGTRKQNMQDASAKGRLSKRKRYEESQTQCAQGHDFSQHGYFDPKHRQRRCRVCMQRWTRESRARNKVTLAARMTDVAV